MRWWIQHIVIDASASMDSRGDYYCETDMRLPYYTTTNFIVVLFPEISFRFALKEQDVRCLLVYYFNYNTKNDR